ncbi:hypothetical protein QBC39DRAFT_376560 [Podospora conica]|nr:hypothetical protein QBC39DRAFT_376560 [Schizothecium conicum]
MALGGSTNIILLLLAIAHEAGVEPTPSTTSTTSPPMSGTSVTSSCLATSTSWTTSTGTADSRPLRALLDPEGAVGKTAGFDADIFEGPARVFERERGAIDSLANYKITKGDTILVRNEGPTGGSGK